MCAIGAGGPGGVGLGVTGGETDGAAGVAFAVDIVVSIVVTLFTQPKPDAELVGFVSSVTPKDHFEDYTEKSLPWYQQTVPLGIICLVMAVALNVIFA